MHGLPYLTRDEAIRQLAELDPPEEPNPWKELMRAPAVPMPGPPGMAMKDIGLPQPCLSPLGDNALP